MNKVIIFLVSSIMLLVSCGDSSQTHHQTPPHTSNSNNTQQIEQTTTNSNFQADTLVDVQDTDHNTENAMETNNSALADNASEKSFSNETKKTAEAATEPVVENVQKPKTTSPPNSNNRLPNPNTTNAVVADNSKPMPSTISSASDRLKNIKEMKTIEIKDGSDFLPPAPEAVNANKSFTKRTEKTQSPKASPTPPKNMDKADKLVSFFADTDVFLKKYVSNGRVAYSKINKGDLDALVQQVAEMDLTKASSTEKQAFYINAYNVSVIKSILDNNLPASPLDVTGFFKNIQHKVAGRSTTLDHLEKQLLFGLKKDARFHFAVVCAAVSCPRIENFAYLPAKLNAQLNQQTKRAVNDTDFTRVNDKKKTVELSKIFEWYKADFEQDGKSLLDFVNEYRNEKVPEKYKVDFYEYDWKLNKQ